MKMKWKFAVVILAVFLLAEDLVSVSAVTNYALTGTPSHANQQAGKNNYLIWTWNDARLNDNSVSNVAHGVVVSDRARYSTWASFESIINFPSPVEQLDRIEAVFGGYGGNQFFRLKAYIDTGAGWQEVGDTGAYIPPSKPYTQVFTGGAPWGNVQRIKVYSYSATTGWSFVDYRLFEIRAFGPDPAIPCTPETDVEFCTRLGGECEGFTGSDNCGVSRTVDCGNCVAPETCQAGICACAPDCAGKECGDNGCGGSCGNCDILYPGEGRVCNAAGICVPSAADITNAFWASMNDSTEIFQADLNDRVRLMVAGTGLAGKTIDFTIFKEVAWWFDTKVAEDSSTEYTTWVANAEGTYYFTASIAGVGSAQSRNLIVSASENNIPPVTEILSPGICEIYFTGESIGFTQTSSDVDDNIAFNWDFGDGSASTSPNPTHAYDSGGQKTIILTVTDERGSTATDRTTILVIDKSKTGQEKYICAYINEPEWGDNVYGFDIFFNATDTYAINASNCNNIICNNIECIAGLCKNWTANNAVDVTGHPNWPGFQNINFSWVFDDGFTYKENGMLGAWFTKTFSTTGSHWAKLTASINPEGSIETNFNIMNKTPQKEIEKSKEDTIIPFKDLILALILLLVIVIIYLRLSKKRRKKKKL